VDNFYFNQTFVNNYLNGKKIDVLKENLWVDYLGEGKENIQLIEQRVGIYKHLRGFDMLAIFFKAKVN
jgi:hypothetical protein